MERQEDDGDDDDYSSTSTSSPSFRFRWDVFLSFRGKDTRYNFTLRLYNELVRNGIRTFRHEEDDADDYVEEINPSLLTAIKDSATSIAIISNNYASSRRCLEELSNIFESRRFLIPVFYQVDPSNVRRRNGPFEDAFRNHEQRFGQDSDKVARWKEAMEKAGGIKGLDSRLNQQESELIQALVKEILTKLSNTPLGVAQHPIGINSRVEEVMRLLEVKCNGVRVVGFHGMGGIGKTTLAKAVYNKIFPQFEHRCFLSNIRATSRQRNGLISLQKTLIRDLFSDNASVVDEVSRGAIVIKQRIRENRVLVVLDDVDDVCQLDALAIRKDWYFEGSRIIITTRDNEVLRQHFVNDLYEVKVLSPTESLQLFSYHAFKREKPTETFMHLSEQVVSITGRLPLALEVLGAFLFDKRRIKEWEDELKKLKQIRPGNLHEVLKTSFDGLDEHERCIFLDIACFFAEMEMKRGSALDIWRGCEFNAEIAITVLTAKNLIKFIGRNTLWMHDQLIDMGREIVQKESFGDPGMRSRLWDHDEVMKVLKYEKGTSSIQGIILNFEKNVNKFPNSKELSRIINRRRPIVSPITYLKEKFKSPSDCEAEKEVKLCTKPFAPMGDLRLLQINHVNLEGKFKLIPGKLKWLQWKECPLEALPSDFCPQNLAVLDLTESGIKRVWDQRWRGGYKMAEKLMVLNLRKCYNLTATPDLSGHHHLEKLILEHCGMLIELHKSIGHLRTLVILNLKNCSNLMELPNDISGLRRLEKLLLSGCRKLKELPEDLSSMKSLRKLLVDDTVIVKLPDSIFHLKKLEKFSLNGCMSLKQLPNTIGQLSSLRELSLNDSALEELPDSIGSLTNLETLSLMRCGSLSTVPDSIGNLESLLELFLNGSSIEELPASIGSLSHLKHLSVVRCRSLKKLPISIGGLASLVELWLDWTSITELPDEIGALNILEKLEMRNCESLSRLPDSNGNWLSLTYLILVNAPITELPDAIGLLEKLEMLNVNKCKQLSRLPSSIGKLKSLQQFLMEETGVKELPEEFGMLSSLKVLKMAKRPHLEQPQNIGEHTELTVLNGQNPKLTVLPDSFSSLSLLQELDARSCNISGIIPDDFEKLSLLEELELGKNNFCSLPSSLRGLSILKKLILPHCIELKSLPPLPSSLTHVDVTNCTALEIISDLSNLENLQELLLTNCKKVIDIPGLEHLKSLRRLSMSGCSACHSVVKRRLTKVALKRIRNLSVPGSEIPNWFVPEVPNFKSHKNREIKGVIIWVVISLDQQKQDAFRGELPVIAGIQAKIVRENKPIFCTALYLMGVPRTHEDQVYLCRYPDCNPIVSLLRDGDKIQVTMQNPPLFQGLQLKKYGIHLVFEGDDDDDDDEESLGETEQSVSERLAKFFRSSEGADHSSGSSSCEVEEGHNIEGRKSNIKTRNYFLGVGLAIVVLLLVNHFCY